jgi:hypothetical protein
VQPYPIWTEKWPTHSSGCFSALSRRFANVLMLSAGQAFKQIYAAIHLRSATAWRTCIRLNRVSFLCAPLSKLVCTPERSPMIVTVGSGFLPSNRAKRRRSGFCPAPQRSPDSPERRTRWFVGTASRATSNGPSARNAPGQSLMVPIYIGGSKTVSLMR